MAIRVRGVIHAASQTFQTHHIFPSLDGRSKKASIHGIRSCNPTCALFFASETDWNRPALCLSFHSMRKRSMMVEYN